MDKIAAGFIIGCAFTAIHGLYFTSNWAPAAAIDIILGAIIVLSLMFFVFGTIRDTI